MVDPGRPSDKTRGPQTRASHWQLRTQTLTFGRLPALMGILNVTPDSFSDGGRFVDPPAAVDHALMLAAQGAAIIDVGGESTRPYADAVDADEELRRVMPVIERLRDDISVPLSIDTSKATVAREAIRAGVEIVNDVTALTGDARMIDVVAEAGVGVCIMHMRGTPRSMQDQPEYDDVVEEVFGYLMDRRDRLIEAGIDQDRIAVDPGIGFGKTVSQNLELLRRIERFHATGCPLLVGHSRKSFLGKVLGDDTRDRTAATIGVSAALAQHGVQVLRVHDVAATAEALKLLDATGGLADS